MTMIESYFPPQRIHGPIDWNHLIKRRNFLLDHVTDIPPYLLLPEIRALLHQTKNPETHLLINTIWHCGPRISEAVELMPKSFIIDDPKMSVVKIITLKKRTVVKRGRPTNKNIGRPIEKKPITRIVPLYSHSLKSELLTYCACNQITGSLPLFSHVRDTYNKRLNRLQDNCKSNGLSFPLKLTPHVFRHSFAVNCLINRIQLSDIRDYLGHASIKETEVYTRIFTGETHGDMANVEF